MFPEFSKPRSVILAERQSEHEPVTKDERDQGMALCTLRFFSRSIQKHDCMNVIVPDGRGPFPVLYLLHGLSDDYSIWLRRTSIERYVGDMRLMVVMPDTHRFFYVNDPRPGGPAYEDHFIRDVIGSVDRIFPTIRRRTGRAVAGLSMGGYGAMMLAMRHPSKFAAVAAHSAAFGFGRKIRTDWGIDPLSNALPRGKYDVFALARKLAKARRRLPIRFDCGTEDFLLENSREFHAHLTKLGIAHEYAEHPGRHDWAYWDEHVGETLAFVRERLAGR